jgi:hypothetical protein
MILFSCHIKILQGARAINSTIFRSFDWIYYCKVGLTINSNKNAFATIMGWASVDNGGRKFQYLHFCIYAVATNPVG